MRGLGDYYMVSEAASALGVTSYLLRKWIADDREGLTPSRTVMFGSTQIYLYTEADLERIKEKVAELTSPTAVRPFDGRRSTGRPRQYSDDERVERGRLQSRRYYWKVRQEEAAFKGDVALMDKASIEIEKIDKKLKEKK